MSGVVLPSGTLAHSSLSHCRATQTEVDHLHLQSTSSLSTGQAITHAQRLAIEEDHAVRRDMETRGGKRKRTRRGKTLAVRNPDESMESDTGESSDSSVMEGNDEAWFGFDGLAPREEVSESLGTTSGHTLPDVGAALRRNPDGTAMTLRVIQRKPKKPGRRVSNVFVSHSSSQLA